MNLDAEQIGMCYYAEYYGTANRPNPYGVCITFGWSGYDAISDWKYQLAFGTGQAPVYRRNINNGGWDSWRSMTS